MRIIDIHLNPLIKPELEKVSDISAHDLEVAYEHFVKRFRELNIEHGVLVILDSTIFEKKDTEKVITKILAENIFTISYCLDFYSGAALEQLEKAYEIGVRVLKFHPYRQRIEPQHYHQAAKLAEYAQNLGMLIMVCCSYGTRALGKYNGVNLAAYLSDHVSCPVIMSHAGGALIIDAMLVAEDAPNIYLETSFSLPYYIGSSIEKDFAFAMRKLGAHRWTYGSDAPFVDIESSLNATLDFLERHGFSGQEIDQIMYSTAASLLLRG